MFGTPRLQHHIGIITITIVNASVRNQAGFCECSAAHPMHLHVPANDSRSRREGDMRLWTEWWMLILAVEALMLAAVIVLTSTRVIGENQAGLVIKRYGRQLPS